MEEKKVKDKVIIIILQKQIEIYSITLELLSRDMDRLSGRVISKINTHSSIDEWESLRDEIKTVIIKNKVTVKLLADLHGIIYY